MSRRLAIFFLVLTMVPSQSQACRYTVRDIGFAALRSHEYAIALSWKVEDDDEHNNSLARSAEEWSQALKAHLAGSNVTVMIDQKRFTERPESLERPESRSTEVASATPPLKTVDENQHHIRIELVDRLGRVINLTESVESFSESLDFAAWLDQNVFISVLNQISTESLESFAHLLIVEGSGERANREMQDVARQAMAAIKRLEPLLPRPIAFPLRKIVLQREQSQQQQVLRWLLGCQDDSLPLLAVVYGRGRLAGSVMHGSSLTLQEVLAQLALVGQSCECETDRAWLEESSLPFRWDGAARSRASSFLGFDPDSPLVRAEMLRIVSQGPKSPGKDKRSSGENSPDTIARMLLGYSETQLENSSQQGTPTADSQNNSQQAAMSNGDQTDSLGKPAGVESTVIAGDGWDFESEVADSTALAENVPASSGVEAVDRADDSIALKQTQLEGSPEQAADRSELPGTESSLDAEYFVVSVPAILVLTLVALFTFSLLVVFTLILRSK